jgi:hypothetical protein
MAKTRLARNEEIARYVEKRALIYDRNDRTRIIGCFPDAFRLRESRSEKYLSAGRLDNKSDTVASVSEIAKDMVAGGRFSIRKGSGFALSVVGDLEDACGRAGVEVYLHPKFGRPRYSEVWNVPQDDDALLQALGLDTWSRVIKSDDLALSESD